MHRQILRANPRRVKSLDLILKTFLTCSEGFNIDAPLFFKQSLNAIRQANRNHSQKRKGHAFRERARLNLARKHENIAHRRRDWFWKLAHQLTFAQATALASQFDVQC